MTAAGLREALARIDGLYPTPEQFQVIEDAARTIALPILEADPELVERVVNAIHLGILFGESREAHGQRVLAAISTPIPVEES